MTTGLDSNTGKGGGGQAAGWFIFAFVISIVAVVMAANSPDFAEVGWFGKYLLAVPVGTILGGLFASIGNVLRKIARPDSVFVGGSSSGEMFINQLKSKFFWAVGPQLIGFGLGIGMGVFGVLGALAG